MSLAYYTINCCNISAITHTVTKMQRMFPCLTNRSKLYPVLCHQKLESNFSHDSIYSAGKLSLTVCSLNKGQIAWKLTPLINLTMDVQFVGQSLLEKKDISYYQSIEFWKKKKKLRESQFNIFTNHNVIITPSLVTIINPVVATSSRPTVNSRGLGNPGFLLSYKTQTIITNFQKQVDKKNNINTLPNSENNHPISTLQT